MQQQVYQMILFLILFKYGKMYHLYDPDFKKI